ncbi:MAG: 4Fe-4S binding protein [Clostridiales bacterium]
MNVSKKKKTKLRFITQLFFLLLVSAIMGNKLLEELGMAIPFLSTASLHAICPFGGVVSIHRFITEGTFVQKIHESSFILMIAGIILAIGFGPLICGWVCPFGTVQEFLSKIGRKIFKKKYNNFIPYKIDRILRYIRYIILILVVYNIASTTKLMFQDIDPYYALFNFWTGEVAIAAYIILGATILLSLIIERPWCKYACPYGAFLGIFNLFRIFKIKRNQKTCINCKACDVGCPMNIKVSEKTKVLDHQCISCMKCTSDYICPIGDTVEFRVGRGDLSES